MSSSGEESIMKRCDQCGGRLGMTVHRKWSWRFCKLTCKTAFMHRRHEEVLRRIRALVTMFGFPGSETSSETEHAGMPAKMKFVLSVLAVLGTASAALALTQSPDHRHSTSVFQSQDQMGVDGSDRIALDSDVNPRQTVVYFDPAPAPFNAYTYSASAQLVASGSKRRLRGEFRFPVFRATPNVSVQIISSISAVPMRVNALKITETDGSSGAVETRIIVEAEPIFDVPASGVYFANLVVTGIPVSPSTGSKPAQLLR
jgi:hypothetical protein